MCRITEPAVAFHTNLDALSTEGTKMSDSKSKEEDFMILEYKALRSEIASDIKELRSLETFAVTGIGTSGVGYFLKLGIRIHYYRSRSGPCGCHA